MAKKIISIQHTQSTHHNSAMPGGWNDWELTALGRKHAENIGLKLSNELTGQNWKIYSSDLKRARQTVEPLARYMGLEIHLLKDLREMNHSGKKGFDKAAKWCNKNSLPALTYADNHFTDAESWSEFWNRIADCCNKITEDKAENIIIASHGMTMSVWQYAWLGLDLRDFEYLGHPGGVSFMQVKDNGSRIINRWNDTSYMNH
jgi:probable phosphoglycerate mutase